MIFLTLTQTAHAQNTAKNKYDERQITCLAKNMFYEARNQSIQGMIGVAFVTMNRKNDQRFPRSVCDVVFERDDAKCQFSWVCQGKAIGSTFLPSLTAHEKHVYFKIRRMAKHIYENYHNLRDPTHGALFFHADYVNPNWKNVKKTVKIDQHIFYASKK